MTPPLDVSAGDTRTYRLISLPNGLRALVASDSTAEYGAAALSVDVGASHDPAGFPGLAHFCEHMLFLGSTKYPEESAYKKFLAAHSGRSNASTSMESTTYQFEVLESKLSEALDIFAQFFIAPLFTESATARELKAVDSEDARNRTNDFRRLLQVLKAAADTADHPWAKFSTGNSETLRGGGAATRDALLDFHRLHYYGGRMTLAVLGTASLDDLESLVRITFAPVAAASRPLTGETADAIRAAAAAADAPNCSIEASSSAASSSSSSSPSARLSSPYAPESLPRVLHMAPLRELRELAILYPTPPVRRVYRASPARLCSHLLGHEAEGSALAALQDRGWATALSAGLRVDDKAFSVMNVKVTLTEEGEKRWRSVVALVDEHCALLRTLDDGEMQRHWGECAELGALDFANLEIANPYNWAQSHARRLALFSPQHVLSGGHVFDEALDVSMAREWMAKLSLQNAIVVINCQATPVGLDIAEAETSNARARAKAAEGHAGAPPLVAAKRSRKKDVPSWVTAGVACGPDCYACTEQWYGVPFTTAPLPPLPEDEDDGSGSCSHTSAGLFLPSANPYIPRDLTLRSQATEALDSHPPPPKQLESSEGGSVWHAVDKRYHLPRVELRLFVFARQLTREERTLAALHASLLTQLLKRHTYDAEVAGLGVSVGVGTRGASIRVCGYSEHAPKLLLQVLSALLKGGCDERGADVAFLAVRERAERRIRSRLVETPASQANFWTEVLLGAGETLPIDAELKQVSSASLGMLRDFHADWKRALHATMLAIGNINEAEAITCHRDVLSALSAHRVAPLPAEARATTARGKLPQGAQYELHAAAGSAMEANSCALITLQAGELVSPYDQACLRVLASILKEPCFRELRTRQQIGYVVSSGHTLDLVHTEGGSKPLRIEGLAISVSSKSLGAAEIVSRIDAFLDEFRQTNLATLDSATVQDHATSLATRLLEPPKRLATESDKWWAQIRDSRYDWGAAERLAKALEQVKPIDVGRMLDRLVACRLTALVYGASHPMSPTTPPTALAAPVRPGGVVVDAEKGAVELARWEKEKRHGHSWRWVAVAAAPIAVVVVMWWRRRR